MMDSNKTIPCNLLLRCPDLPIQEASSLTATAECRHARQSGATILLVRPVWGVWPGALW